MSVQGCSFTTEDLKFASLIQILPVKYSDMCPSESSVRGRLLFGRMYIEKSESDPDTIHAVLTKTSSPGYIVCGSLSKSFTLISIK
jgi:hypothetical protein